MSVTLRKAVQAMREVGVTDTRIVEVILQLEDDKRVIANSIDLGGCQRRPIPAHLQDEVIGRSLGRCVVCDSEDNIHIDHIIPVSRGGTNHLDNLQVLCAKCNLSKGARTMDEWLGPRDPNAPYPLC